ncbi:ATP-binding protein [Brevundimonas sp.]|uniref:ATP-binding protein n=1 Tax=Brevundimonas sp. TaxID=1871086 RepID=UPI003F7028B1
MAFSSFHLGFDAEFDQSAPATRAKTVERVLLSVAVLLVSLAPVGGLAVSWWVVSVIAEVMLWRSTDPEFMGRRPGAARALRVAASAVAASAWVFCALLMWFAGTPVSTLLAIALLAAIALYIIASCHETPIHMIAAGTPPALGLLSLPLWLSGTLTDRILLGLSMALLVSFGASSAIRSYRAHMRLKQTAELLEEQTHKAQAANRAKSEFLANMSHEIRTPLNGVLAVSDALSLTSLSAQQQTMLGLISSSGRVLQQLLSDILDLARIETARMEIHPAPFDLSRAVQDVVQLHAAIGEAKGLEIVLVLDDEIDVQVLGDVVRFKQVLTNLISNAIKFTETGHVRVTGSREMTKGAPRFHFSIEDTGVGFDAESAERMFNRFEQVDSSITRRFGGSGLGLAICSELVALMGGEIFCKSERGRGSTFSFVVPLEPTASTEIQPEPAAPMVAALQGPARRLRVLAADDHPTNRKVVELVLSQADVDLVLVEDGAMAVEAVSNQSFDVILMDMQMPVMDGLTATRAIRAIEAAGTRARTPIIMLTANALPEHVAQATAAGADRHMAKPLNAAELLNALGALEGPGPSGMTEVA